MRYVFRKLLLVLFMGAVIQMVVACNLLKGLTGQGLTTVQGGALPYGLKVQGGAGAPEGALYGVYPAQP